MKISCKTIIFSVSSRLSLRNLSECCQSCCRDVVGVGFVRCLFAGVLSSDPLLSVTDYRACGKTLFPDPCPPLQSDRSNLSL